MTKLQVYIPSNFVSWDVVEYVYLNPRIIYFDNEIFNTAKSCLMKACYVSTHVSNIIKLTFDTLISENALMVTLCINNISSMLNGTLSST